MDNIDLSILAFLQRDGRKPYTEIAQALGVSEGTVRNRVARLIDDQVVHFVGLVDPYRMGFDAPAMIGISVQPAELQKAAISIASFQEVSYLIMVSGEYDLLVEVMCRDRQHLADFLNNDLHKVPGVLRTRTNLILHTYKMAYGARPMIDLPVASKGVETNS